MKKVAASAIWLLLIASTVMAQTAPDAAELTKLLNDFLAGASRNDPAVHERFWADDLIYTRSAGRRVGKADIMRGLRDAPAPKPDDPKTVYTAEDIRIQQYGDTAIVAFRLVATTESDGAKQIAHLLNSGTFIKREGKWQVVNWQSTRMPRTEEENQTDVSAAAAAFHQALLAADTKKLNALIDQSFIWTDDKGEQITRQQLIDDLSAGKLKYAKLETAKETVSVYGETAVVRGESLQQRSAIPRATTGDTTSTATIRHTLTLINQNGAWKIVALHTS